MKVHKQCVILVRCEKCGHLQQTLVNKLQNNTSSGYVKCIYCNKSINKKKSFVRFVN